MTLGSTRGSDRCLTFAEFVSAYGLALFFAGGFLYGFPLRPWVSRYPKPLLPAFSPTL